MANAILLACGPIVELHVNTTARSRTWGTAISEPFVIFSTGQKLIRVTPLTRQPRNPSWIEVTEDGVTRQAFIDNAPLRINCAADCAETEAERH